MTSWITELGLRLQGLEASAESNLDFEYDAILPLFVDAKELWVLFEAGRSDLADIALFSSSREDAKTTPLRTSAADRLQLSSQTLLSIGYLPVVRSAEGPRVRTEVVAIPPHFRLDTETPDRRMHRIPLSALATPRLVEARKGFQEGEEVTFKVCTFGNLPVWGATLEIVRWLTELK